MWEVLSNTLWPLTELYRQYWDEEGGGSDKPPHPPLGPEDQGEEEHKEEEPGRKSSPPPPQPQQPGGPTAEEPGRWTKRMSAQTPPLHVPPLTSLNVSVVVESVIGFSCPPLWVMLDILLNSKMRLLYSFLV